MPGVSRRMESAWHLNAEIAENGAESAEKSM